LAEMYDEEEEATTPLDEILSDNENYADEKEDDS